MSDQSAEILERIVALEAELERRLETQRRLFRYTVERERVKFEAAARERHKELRTGLVRFVLNSGALQIVAALVIYMQLIPLLLVDLAVTLFQAISFPIYGIAKVTRADYIVLDRHHLAYLNVIEKLNCVYCGYANGVLAYAREIAGRTEQYWCPIRHATQIRGAHSRYKEFVDYGDAAGYRVRLEELRAKLR